MIESGIVTSIDEKLYRITDKIDYKSIIENNYDSLKDMIEVFYNICGGKEKIICIVPSKTNIKK